jgi:hypothetical protein
MMQTNSTEVGYYGTGIQTSSHALLQSMFPNHKRNKFHYSGNEDARLYLCLILSKSYSCSPPWSSGYVLANEPKVRRFKPGRGRWIFKGDKNS